jgi:tripartite ATP-independent transporter DctM subunit
LLIAFFRPKSAPAMPAAELADFRAVGMYRRIIRAFLLPFFLILAVLGSIFAGIASPTEAAAVGALGATLLTLWQKKLSMQTLREVMRGTTTLTCMVFILLVGATAFGLVFRGLNGDRYITGLIMEAGLEAHHFLFIVMLVIFIAGFFIDFIEITFIIVPVVAPIFQHMGVDLLWVGILIALNLQTSFLTPPFGFSLFYLKGVAPPQVSTAQIYRGIIPFIAIQLVCLVMVVFWPETVTWLPKVMAKHP